MQLTPQQLRKLLGNDLFYSAHEYVQMGNVKKIKVTENRIYASVQGTDIYPFDVDIELSEKSEPLSVLCSCSNNKICIHVAAAMISALIESRKNSKNPSKRSIPPESEKSAESKESINHSNSLQIIEAEPVSVVEISPGKKRISYSIYFRYGKCRVEISDMEDPVFEKKRDIHRKNNTAYKRKFQREKEVTSYLKNKFKDIAASGENILNLSSGKFIPRFAVDLHQNGIVLKMRGRVFPVVATRGEVRFTSRKSCGTFRMESFFESDNKKLQMRLDHDFLKYNLVLVDNRFCQISHSDRNRLKKLALHGMNEDGEITFSEYDFRYAELFDESVTDSAVSGFSSFKKKAIHLKNSDIEKNFPVPENWKASLRPYQQHGYNWLNFLHAHELNGCLADDMGLGKTVQTLCFLQKLHEDNKLKTSLLVVPVITISNWENEKDKFAPELKLLVYRGENRKSLEYMFGEYDLVITSYQTLRIDQEIFRKHRFKYIILDEAQNIKNPDSKTTKAVKTIESGHRLSLTGTPFENSTLDLWSQMDFLNPGILGSRKMFTDKYLFSQNNDDSRIKEELKARISPFILRRKKADVLHDLPPKEEITLFCEMDEYQMNAYNALKIKLREQIMESADEKVFSSGLVFTSILRLRQMTLFPVLAGEEFSDITSCKFEMLKSITEKVVSEENRMLIFSQFVKNLQIMKKFFDKKSIEYSYLDGSTRNRREEISAFKDSKENNIFLLSLKAAGVGINLTEADYVLLFDPWWNPAVENQAIDRAHRIGRKEKIIAYRLIVKDTIEEKILKINEKKSQLAEELIASDTEIPEIFNQETILSLFE